VEGTAGFQLRQSGNPVCDMPDRAIIPLLPALALGFICGIVASALLLGDGGTWAVGVAGAVAVGIIASSSVFGASSDTGEKAIVAVLRALTAMALFVAVYLFILAFLRNGQPLMALVWLVMAFAFAMVLTRLRVRDRGELRSGDSSEPA
jgi:hypothetical protein